MGSFAQSFTSAPVFCEQSSSCVDLLFFLSQTPRGALKMLFGNVNRAKHDGDLTWLHGFCLALPVLRVILVQNANQVVRMCLHLITILSIYSLSQWLLAFPPVSLLAPH